MTQFKTIATFQQPNNSDLSIDCDLIIAHTLMKERTFVLAHPEHIPTQKQYEQISSLIKRRETGEPLAYVLGTKEFYGYDFNVTPDTLIPRPETELIIDLVIAHTKESSHTAQKIFIDVGTGSGNIIITLAKQLGENKLGTDTDTLIATDISPKALTIAKKNAKKHNVDKTISFLEGNLLTPVKISPSASLVIIANLPYVDTAIKDTLLHREESQGLAYEPPEALWSPDHGLAHYKELLVQTKELTKHNRFPLTNYYEINPDQKDLLQNEILARFPTATTTFHKDLANKWRICEWSL